MENEYNYYPLEQSVIDANSSPSDIVPNSTPTAPSDTNVIPSGNGTMMYGGTMQSSNYVADVAGWLLDSNGNIKGVMILTNGGRIANWYIFTNTISSGATASTADILLDSANGLIRVGSSTGNYITIDGTNLRIRSSNYVAGATGFTIEPSLIETDNILARGEFRSQVLSYGSVHATAGTELLALSGGTLKNDVTTLTSPSTFNVDINDPPSGHVQVFSTSDILRIKDGSGGDNWMTVSSVSDQTTFYRYVCTKNNGTNTTFRAGAAVVNYGQSGQGIIVSTVDQSNAPYISIQTHAGSPWSTVTERLRIGNLNGFLDYASNLYGIGIGETSKYLTYDPTNGLRIAGNIQALTFLTAGENLTAGDSVQIGGDYQALMSQDTYTSSAFATTNYGSTNPLNAGNSGSPADIEMWFQFDTSNLPPSTNITSAVLSFNVTSVGGGTHGLSLYRVTGASWAEGTLTHNNKPALNGSTFATLAGVNSTGVKTIDITTQVQNWQNGTHNNYGFVIQTDNGSSTLAVSSREDATNFPYVTITFSSGKVYKASASTSNATNRWLGFCFTTTTAGNSAPIQISNNYITSGLTTDTPYYQSDTRGAIATSAGTNSKKIGLSTSTTELLILNT